MVAAVAAVVRDEYYKGWNSANSRPIESALAAVDGGGMLEKED